jgi:hypothetical protein
VAATATRPVIPHCCLTTQRAQSQAGGFETPWPVNHKRGVLRRSCEVSALRRAGIIATVRERRDRDEVRAWLAEERSDSTQPWTVRSARTIHGCIRGYCPEGSSGSPSYRLREVRRINEHRRRVPARPARPADAHLRGCHRWQAGLPPGASAGDAQAVTLDTLQRGREGRRTERCSAASAIRSLLRHTLSYRIATAMEEYIPPTSSSSCYSACEVLIAEGGETCPVRVLLAVSSPS